MNPETLRHLVDQRLRQIQADADRRHVLARAFRPAPAAVVPRPDRVAATTKKAALNA